MARLWSSGFELNSVTAGVEWSNVSGSISLSTTTVRSGTYALRLNPTASTAGVAQVLLAAAAAINWYGRVYLYITSAPTVAINIIGYLNGTTAQCNIVLNTDRTLSLKDGGNAATIGTSAALNTGQWYRIELHCDSTGAANHRIYEALLDGLSFASTITGTSSSTVDRVQLGTGSTSSTHDLFLDDVAINDTSGSSQTGYPGDGKILHLSPNAAGDSAQWTVGGSLAAATNWASVAEITPDDAVTLVKNKTLNNADLYGVAPYLVNESMAVTPPSGTLVNNNGGSAVWSASGWYQLTNNINQYANLEYTAILPSTFTATVDMKMSTTSGADSCWFYYGCSTTPTTEADVGGIGYVIERNDFGNTIAIRYGGTSLTSISYTKDTNFDTFNIGVVGQTFTITYKGSVVITYTDSVTRTLPGSKFGWGARCGGQGNTHTIQNMRLSTPVSTYVGASDTINVVAVGARFANDIADTTAAFKLQIEKTASGTKTQSSAIVPNSTTWNTNAIAAPRTYPLTTYQDPDSGAWTQTTLGTLQAGPITTVAHTNFNQISDLWVLVDWTPGVAVTNYASWASQTINQPIIATDIQLG